MKEINQEVITMEETSQTEQELSAEQLREITGGCEQCQKDLREAHNSQKIAHSLIEESQQAAADGKINNAKRFFNMANGHTQRAQRILGEVKARGHNLQPHGNLPDLNGPPSGY